MGRLDDSRQPGRATDDIDRAHLRDPADDSFVISRYLPPDALQGWIRRYWVPVWDVPAETPGADWAAPAAELQTRLEAALGEDAPLTADERRARAGLLSRQVTLR